MSAELQKMMYYSENTDCYTYFRMTGNFDPDKISQILRLEPDETAKIGDIKPNGKKYDYAVWSFGRCDEYDLSVENQMLKTISPLMPKIETLKEIKKKYDVSFTLEVVPTIRFDEPTPSLAPSLTVMQFCCDTQTEMDIDLYVSSPDDYDEN